MLFEFDQGFLGKTTRQKATISLSLSLSNIHISSHDFFCTGADGVLVLDVLYLSSCLVLSS